jgi:endonuclease/exonuclease/phosphatase family metal-dependent hydrolase
MRFSVLTLNIQNGQPWDEADPDNTRLDVEGVGDFLRAQDADIICLQEVERGYDGGSQVEPPPNYSRLKDMLPGHESVFGYPRKNKCEIPFGLGLAIFSRFPVSGFRRVDLPAAPITFEFGGKERCASERLLLGVDADIGGRSVRVMNTHLQAFFMIGSTSDRYPEQRDMVEGLLRGVTGPALLAGDMNSAPGEGLVRQFGGVGFQSVQNATPTWKRRPYVVDHIFHNEGMRVVSVRVVPTSSSDHDAVLAEFELV